MANQAGSDRSGRTKNTKWGLKLPQDFFETGFVSERSTLPSRWILETHTALTLRHHRPRTESADRLPDSLDVEAWGPDFGLHRQEIMISALPLEALAHCLWRSSLVFSNFDSLYLMLPIPDEGWSRRSIRVFRFSRFQRQAKRVPYSPTRQLRSRMYSTEQLDTCPFCT